MLYLAMSPTGDFSAFLALPLELRSLQPSLCSRAVGQSSWLLGLFLNSVVCEGHWYSTRNADTDNVHVRSRAIPLSKISWMVMGFRTSQEAILRSKPSSLPPSSIRRGRSCLSGQCGHDEVRKTLVSSDLLIGSRFIVSVVLQVKRTEIRTRAGPGPIFHELIAELMVTMCPLLFSIYRHP